MLSRDEKVMSYRVVETPAGVRGRLSPRQQEVLDGILAGKPNRLIAQELTLSPRTVEAHRAAIMSKVGVASLAELVRATSKSSDGADSLDMMCRIYPGLVSFWDSGLIARFANNVHETFIGKSVDDILGRSMEEVLGTFTYQQSMPFIRGVLSGKTQYFTQIMRLPSGRPASVCTVYSPQFGALGDVEGFFAFMIDTRALPDDAGSADGEAQDADAASWAEMVLDEESRIVSVNEAFTDVTQFRLNEVRGHTPIMIRPLGVEPSTFMKFWSDRLAERRWHGMVWYRRRDGYLFRSRQQVVADPERPGPATCRVRFSEIKIF